MEKNPTNAKIVSLETIPLMHIGLDGKGMIAKQFDELVKAAIHDCDARAAVDKPRKVILEVALTPALDSAGHLETVAVDITCKASGPSFGPVGLKARYRQGDRLVFQPMSPDDPYQDSLPGLVDQDTGEVTDE